MLKKRLPTVTPVEAKDAEALAGTYGRLIDFKESFLYDRNLTMSYIYYMRNFQNLFDLEFFANKLPSKTYSIAGLE